MHLRSSFAFAPAGQFDEAAKAALDFEEILGKGDYFLEIQEHGLDAQRRIRKPLAEFSQTYRRSSGGDERLALPDAGRRQGPRRAALHRYRQDDQRPESADLRQAELLCSIAEEMWRTFGDDCPSCCSRTLEIAERCDLEFPKAIDHLPLYPIPEADGGSRSTTLREHRAGGF